MLDPRYQIKDEASVMTPALAIYPKLIYENIERLVSDVGRADRLRPHAKTHKIPQMVAFLRAFGITKHKCATLAEAEMLASAGAGDVVIAYPMVGPNVGRFLELQTRFPQTIFRPIVDCLEHIEHLSSAAQTRGRVIEALLDVDVGMGRTGTKISEARDRFQQLSASLGLRPAGLHVYDGHVHDPDTSTRHKMVSEIWSRIQGLVQEIERKGGNIPRIIVGGTGGFPHWGKLTTTEPRLECSPGTLILNDAGYRTRYQDLPYFPSAVLLGRVISKPGSGRLTIDLGSKAVAPDCDVIKRVELLNIPDAKIVSQHEEHLVVETPAAISLPIGALVYAWPNHICPTVALHQEVLVVENGDVVDTWPVIGRDRRLSI